MGTKMPQFVMLFFLSVLSFVAHTMDPAETPKDLKNICDEMLIIHRKIHNEILNLDKKCIKQSHDHFAEGSQSEVRKNFPFYINDNIFLGSGEESDVYTGVDSRDGSKCVFRILSEKKILPQDKRAKFENEVKILSSLGVLKGCLYIEHETSPILVINYAPGFKLDSPNVQMLSFGLKAIIAKEIVIAVQNFYKSGFFHRDIKLDNLHVAVIDNWPVVGLIDFGRTCHIVNATKDMTGAPFMLPPEAFNKPWPTYNYAYEIHSVGRAMAFFLSHPHAEGYYAKKSSPDWCRHEMAFEACIVCNKEEFLLACEGFFSRRDFEDYKIHKNFYIFISVLRDSVLWMTEPRASDRPSPEQTDLLIEKLNTLEISLKEIPPKRSQNQKATRYSIDLSSIIRVKGRNSPGRESSTGLISSAPEQRSQDAIVKKKSNGLIRTSPKKKSS